MKGVIVCVENDTPGPRITTCPSPLHDHPLPSGYLDASRVAARRLRQGWKNKRCSVCKLYGWRAP